MILVQLTDLHAVRPGRAVQRVSETNMLLDRAFRAVATLRGVKPDAVVISGDVGDDMTVEAYHYVRESAARHIPHIPVYAIPGNHDDRTAMREGLTFWPGMNADPDFIHYAVDDLPVRLVMLDTLIPGRTEGEMGPQRLAWLDRTLSAKPDVPTIVVMHHPPFAVGVAHMDLIQLRDAAAFAGVIARHKQVERILCGHHHRPVTTRVAHAIASIAPSVAHQVELDLSGSTTPFFFMEPAAFQIHLRLDDGSLVSHTAYVEAFPGPFPFVAD